MVEKPGIKIIDFDDFVFFTTESKSIILMPGFFLRRLLPAATKVTNMDYFIP